MRPGAWLRRLVRRRHATSDRPTALLIEVPEARALLAACGEDRPADGPPGLPPHVTLLYPFVAETAVDAALLARLERIASERPTVPFELRHTDRFPGVLYVAPEPSAPFSDLIRLLWRAWPEHPPYGGAYATIVPHLTLIEGRPEPPDVERRMADLLPLPRRGHRDAPRHPRRRVLAARSAVSLWYQCGRRR